MRYLLALLILLVAAGGGFLAWRQLTAGPPVVLPPPQHLAVSAGNGALLPGGWTDSHSLILGASSRKVAAGVDIEVRRRGQRFTGTPNASSINPVQAVHRGDPAVWVHLGDGSYTWRVRLHNKHGVSPWVHYHGVIHIDTRPPTAPNISSATDPNPAKTYHSSTMSFAWTSSDTGAGIAGYSYRLDSDPHGTARPELRTADTSVRLTGLDTGKWYFHVRALDRAGNWGPSTTFPVHIDVTPPGLAHVRFSLFQFDPQFDALHISFAVTRPATTLRVGVYRQNSGSLVRLYTLPKLAKGQRRIVTWNGKDKRGNLVPAGSYEIYVRAIDRWGHSSLTGWRDFVVDYRRIVVSLSQQRLWAYDGSHVVLTSLVTTGNRALPTPKGTYHIMGKFHPFTFISPWPKSSRFYYPPSKVQYALLFREGGYFIHDAPWRAVFGPGSNLQLGTPGTNYTGTHGCVNVPPNIAQELYHWAKTGTVVQIES